eukprot:scaffold123256_cov32-Tisochrysis_lutea.AAC.2
MSNARRATPAFKCGARWHGASLSCVDTLLGGARVEVVTRQHGHRCSRSTALGTGALFLAQLWAFGHMGLVSTHLGMRYAEAMCHASTSKL